MKYLKLSFLFLLFFVAFGCNEKEAEVEEPVKKVEDKNEIDEPLELVFTQNIKPVLIEYTSTGCPGCGSWGKPTFNKMINTHKEDITPLAIHIKYGDPMITAFSNEIAANRYGSFFTPQLWVNDSNAVIINGGYIQGAESEARMNTLINNYKVNSPNILGDISYVKNDNQLKVRYGIKTSESVEDVFVSLFLQENGIENRQSGYTSNPATHDYVLRQAAFDKTFGDEVKLNSKSFYELSNEMILDSENGSFQLLLMVWKKVGTRFVVLGGINKNIDE
jgi:hypothetical protein